MNTVEGLILLCKCRSHFAKQMCAALALARRSAGLCRVVYQTNFITLIMCHQRQLWTPNPCFAVE